jgi:predicted Ser/Thr protein kinase
MDPELTSVKVLEAFLKEKKLSLEEKIAKGFSSQIYLVKEGKRKLALKMERKDSPRKMMVEKEAKHLKEANKAGIGPKLVGFDLEKRIILYEFVEGRTFNRWLNQEPSREDLLKVLKQLFAQANKLDEMGLSHGQLAGRGANIIVTPKLEVVLLDFEKASQERRARNAFQLLSLAFLNPRSTLTKRIKGILAGQ